MADSINSHIMPESETERRIPKHDDTIDKPFCVQAHDKYGMFSFVVCSKPDENNKGDK
jgi:hypothetical protein